MASSFKAPHLLQIPVLIMVFNRPEPAKIVFQAIREAKPPRLYIASDGARKEKEGEAKKVNYIREYLLQHIDWECEVKTLFREENLGCKYAVDGAIRWFFSLEEKGIVLEDDCLPSLRFFYFCEEMLNKFEYYPNVAAVGGRNQLDTYCLDPGYFFSRKFFGWGWASWASKIQYADVEKGYGKLEFNYKKNLAFHEIQLVKSNLNAIQSGTIEAWDWPYDLSFRERDMLTVLPAKNLVKNIGFGEDATHTKINAPDDIPWYNELKVDLSKEVEIKASDDFIKKFIIQRYKNNYNLILSANIDKLKPFIKIYKSIFKR